MKNFLELRAIDLKLEVVVNNSHRVAGLQDPLRFSADDTVTVDGIEILPKYKYLATGGTLAIEEPFYCWLHNVSGQGWLLKPY